MKRNRYYTLIGLTIGDGNIHNPKLKNGSKRAYLDIAHHLRHMDYIEYKKSILDNININCKIGIKKSKNIPKLIKVYTTGYHILESIRNRFYKNGKRKFYKRWVKNITPEILAIYWMDDGCFCKSINKKKNNYEYHYGDITAISYDKKSIENLLLCFSQYGINGYLNYIKRNDGYRIRFNKENLYKLCNLIKPYVLKIPSMHYKINYL
jgi:hypothetical protein